MSIGTIASPSVYLDVFSDYIPVLSTLTNLVDLFQKLVFVPFIDDKYIKSSHYYTHLQNKSFQRCFALLFPVVGNLIIVFYDVTALKVHNDLKKEIASIKVEGVDVTT